MIDWSFLLLNGFPNNELISPVSLYMTNELVFIFFFQYHYERINLLSLLIFFGQQELIRLGYHVPWQETWVFSWCLPFSPYLYQIDEKFISYAVYKSVYFSLSHTTDLGYCHSSPAQVLHLSSRCSVLFLISNIVRITFENTNNIVPFTNPHPSEKKKSSKPKTPSPKSYISAGTYVCKCVPQNSGPSILNW